MGLQQLIEMNMQTRKLVYMAVRDVSAENWLAIPENFPNNIAWNIGHIMVAQQSLLYYFSGNKMTVPKTYGAMYKPGSSPTDWENQPDIDELKQTLKANGAHLLADTEMLAASSYKEYTTSTGVTLKTIEESVMFNHFHEGLHLGYILALKDNL